MSDFITWDPSWTHLLRAKASVDDLYRFRDHFFEEHEMVDAKNKNKYVEEKLELLKVELENSKAECEQENRALYIYLKGRALNVLPNYDAVCEELLSRTVKLNPRLIAAWNELGECFWKKGDINSAMDCFTGAINRYNKDKVSLRNLSMVLRQLPAKSNDEKVSNVEEGLKKAKEAVNLDPEDGISLTVLGNAYVQAFFFLSQDPKTLELCMDAYSKAEKDIVAKSSSDLYYNKAVLWRYKEEFEKALEALERARCLDPLWADPLEKQTQLLNYLEKVQDLVQHKGRLKKKRLQQVLKRFSQEDLGCYGPRGSNGLKQVSLNELSEGKNEVIVLGKVVCTVFTEESVPFVFCIVDNQNMCVGVSLYNLAAGKGMVIGDSVAIPNPLFSNIKVKYKDKEFAFPLIRVDNPLSLVVNGKPLGRENIATVQSASFKKIG